MLVHTGTQYSATEWVGICPIMIRRVFSQSNLVASIPKVTPKGQTPVQGDAEVLRSSAMADVLSTSSLTLASLLRRWKALTLVF